MDVHGKVALVTGGSDGIGREIALQLQVLGASVIVTGRSAEKLQAMAALGFDTIIGDLSQPSGIDAVVDGVAGKPLALLVNNAGGGSDYELDDVASLDSAATCIDTNLYAPIALITRLLPQLKAAREAKIVNVTSGLAIAPRAGGPIYCATKAALRSYTQAIRYQLRNSNVKVAEALPPLVATNMTKGRGGKMLPAADCAAQIIRGVQADTAEIAVGQTKIMRFIYGISPSLARRIMIKY